MKKLEFMHWLIMELTGGGKVSVSNITKQINFMVDCGHISIKDARSPKLISKDEYLKLRANQSTTKEGGK